jgi:hypothetical protein
MHSPHSSSSSSRAATAIASQQQQKQLFLHLRSASNRLISKMGKGAGSGGKEDKKN